MTGVKKSHLFAVRSPGMGMVLPSCFAAGGIAKLEMEDKEQKEAAIYLALLVMAEFQGCHPPRVVL